MMKNLIDKVGARNLVAAVIVGLGVAGIVLVATGQFSDEDSQPATVQTTRPRPTPSAETTPHSFPGAPADESRSTTRYGDRRSDGGYSYDQYYGSEYDDDAAEDYYGYYGIPYEDEDDGEAYVTPPPEEYGGSGTSGESGQPGYPYGGDGGSGGMGGEGGPGGAGGGG